MSRTHCRVRIASVLFLSLFVSVTAFAEEPTCPEPVVPISALLLPPPKQDSAETKAELQELLRLEKLRTPNQAKHASGDHQRTIGRFLGEIGIEVENLPSFASHFFDCIAKSTEQEVGEAKATFNRTRPYMLAHNRLHILKKVGKDDLLFALPSPLLRREIWSIRSRPYLRQLENEKHAEGAMWLRPISIEKEAPLAPQRRIQSPLRLHLQNKQPSTDPMELARQCNPPLQALSGRLPSYRSYVELCARVF